jgi:hypothetical protein
MKKGKPQTNPICVLNAGLRAKNVVLVLSLTEGSRACELGEETDGRYNEQSSSGD